MEKLEMLIEKINEGEFSAREIVLSGGILFLTGILLGMLISPKKHVNIGCNNGNGWFEVGEDDFEDEE